MSTLDRYVWKELGPPFAIGVGVFTFFLFIDRIYQLTNLIIAKNVPANLVFSLLIYMLPAFLVLALPMALLVAVLLSCGRLAGDMEVIALKATGVSPLRLLRPFAVAGVVISLVTACLTLVVSPWAMGAFQRQLFKIFQSRAAAGVLEHSFSAFGQLVVYVDDVTPSQLGLRGVLVSDERDPQRSRIIIAKEGSLLSDEQNRRVTFRFLNGSINETEAADPNRFRHTAFTLYDMTVAADSQLSPSSKNDKPERQLSLGQLLTTAEDLGSKRQKVEPYYVEFHKRFALPVAALVFVLVGYPLGSRSHRGGRAVALASSFGIVVTYYIVFTSLEGLALGRHMPVVLAIWLPNILFGLLGLGLLKATTTTTGIPTRWTHAFWLFVARIPALRRRRAARSFGRGAATRPRLRGPRASTFVIDRYLIRQYVFFIILGLVVGFALYVVVDLLQTLDRFLRVKPRLVYILLHFAYNGPGEIYKGLPLIVLIATVFLFLSMTRQRELEALMAAGVSLYRVSLPILLAALVISGLAVLFQEAALPGLSAWAEEVDRVKIRGMLPRHLQRQGQVWYRSADGRFLRMALFDPVDKSIEGLLLLEVDREFELVDRLDARKARWTPHGWLLTDVIDRRIDAKGEVKTVTFPSRLVAMPEHTDDFAQIQKSPDQMSYLELRSFVARLRESGHQVGKYLVELHSRLSFPLVHFIVALVAIPFALASPRSGGRAMGIGVAIAIAIGYYLVNYVAIAFARADLLPPALAAWIANIVFAGLGTALFLNART